MLALVLDLASKVSKQKHWPSKIRVDSDANEHDNSTGQMARKRGNYHQQVAIMSSYGSIRTDDEDPRHLNDVRHSDTPVIRL